MQTADLRNRDHLSFRWMLDSTWHRCITFQRKMSARFVIVCEIDRKNSSQVDFVEHDKMIKAFAQAFNVRILPGRSWCRYDFFDAHVLDTLTKDLAVDRISIAK